MIRYRVLPFGCVHHLLLDVLQLHFLHIGLLYQLQRNKTRVFLQIVQGTAVPVIEHIGFSRHLIKYVCIYQLEFIVFGQAVFCITEFQITRIHEVIHLFLGHGQVDGRHGVEVYGQHTCLGIIIAQRHFRAFQQVLCHPGGDFLLEKFHLLHACFFVHTLVVFFQRLARHLFQPGVHTLVQLVGQQLGVVRSQFAHQPVHDASRSVICQENLLLAVLHKACIAGSPASIVYVSAICRIQHVDNGHPLVTTHHGHIFTFRMKRHVQSLAHGIHALHNKELLCVIGSQ